VPALHGGTPYVKRPPEPKWPVWPSFSDGVERLKDPIDAKPSEYRGYAEDSQELPDMKFVSSARPEIWTMRASAGGFLPDDSPRPDFILNASPPNPKTLVGRTKVPMLTVIPETALVRLARALQYGAFHAPRKDTPELGYGPKNWRDQQIEYMTYVDAAMRHLLAAADGEDIDPDTGEMQVGHLEEAMATLAILIDARIQGTCIDNRHTLPVFRGVAGQMLRQMRSE
jgi:hypothetical protein